MIVLHDKKWLLFCRTSSFCELSFEIDTDSTVTIQVVEKHLTDVKMAVEERYLKSEWANV